MKKISVLIAGRHATSISLEDEFYQELLRIAEEQKISRNELITQIDSTRNNQNLSAAIRIYILKYLQEKLAAPERFGQKHQ
ncbi:MAG: ribbon-helix-helix domain-containing protein [Alphaproteobacteria bacterium]|jgi:predicted DNA-binding ribbon-helix-helix protein|nr:ribbon-helix-helix domain-containing protein [Alphaproteobacteria bacterium]MBP5353180.1 ribbon-helix-helix domain-containing protein [Alphaproteobacteria bacterium]